MKYPRYVLAASAGYEESSLFGDAIAVANTIEELDKFVDEVILAAGDRDTADSDELKDELWMFDTTEGKVKSIFLYDNNGGSLFTAASAWKALKAKEWSEVHFSSFGDVWKAPSLR